MEKERCVAVVLAGGCGKRMGTALAKQYLTVRERPILCYALDAFEESEWIDEIILVAGKGMISYCRQEIVEKYGYIKIRTIVEGGAERYHSVWAALQTLEQERMKGYVFIHDGARPFVDGAIIRRAYEAVRECGACVVGMPVKDTIKIADESGCVAATPRRNLVWQIQTPQVFVSELIISAYRKLMEKEEELLEQGVQITDDAMVVETFGECSVRLVEGSYENMKITTPEDLEVAEMIVGRKI